VITASVDLGSSGKRRTCVMNGGTSLALTVLGLPGDETSSTLTPAPLKSPALKSGLPLTALKTTVTRNFPCRLRPVIVRDTL
jgi:hypothetical protein